MYNRLYLLLIVVALITFFTHTYLMTEHIMTTQDIMDRIKEMPMTQDKGIILEEELIIVENMQKKVDK